VGFDVTDQLLIRFSAFVRYWRKNLNTMNEAVHQLFRLQENICFSEEGSIIQYSHKSCGIHETSQVDQHVFKLNI
jgi:hypothetical protein